MLIDEKRGLQFLKLINAYNADDDRCLAGWMFGRLFRISCDRQRTFEGE